ncbi:MAG: type II toxin-antitoxin system Phd/YefM family antitoxin [Jatrophihabitans sp.]
MNHARLVILVRMMTSLPLAEVRSQLHELISRVSSQRERVTVTVNGQPAVVLLAADELESLEETIAVLSGSGAMRQLAQAEVEIGAGQGESEAELTEAMSRRIGIA